MKRRTLTLRERARLAINEATVAYGNHSIALNSWGFIAENAWLAGYRAAQRDQRKKGRKR